VEEKEELYQENENSIKDCKEESKNLLDSLDRTMVKVDVLSDRVDKSIDAASSLISKAQNELNWRQAQGHKASDTAEGLKEKDGIEYTADSKIGSKSEELELWITLVATQLNRPIEEVKAQVEKEGGESFVKNTKESLEKTHQELQETISKSKTELESVDVRIKELNQELIDIRAKMFIAGEDEAPKLEQQEAAKLEEKVGLEEKHKGIEKQIGNDEKQLIGIERQLKDLENKKLPTATISEKQTQDKDIKLDNTEKEPEEENKKDITNGP
ncbi:MAG: hypothetical protein KKE11_03795, partial [Gammaproteobacteria bacterium]|nr:hypothetical protein [Gammaproteobacteria bacterium]